MGETPGSDLPLLIQHRSDSFRIAAHSTWTVRTLKSHVEKFSSIPPEYQKLLLRGSLLSDNSTLESLGIPPGAKILLMGTPKNVVDAVKRAKPDPLVRGFSSRKGKTKRPYVNRPIGWNSEYGFGRVEELPGYEDGQRARELLERLANDKQVLAVMNQRMWRVGVLKEMEPHGRVGVDPVCVLGLNVGKGSEIHLRLRTDDKKGFRHYWKIKEVLWHELSHNVYSEHDAKFYRLMRDIEIQGKEADYAETKGYTVGGFASGSQAPAAPDPLDEPEFPDSRSLTITERLGGAKGSTSVREDAGEAAERRRARAKSTRCSTTEGENHAQSGESDPKTDVKAQIVSSIKPSEDQETENSQSRIEKMGYSAVLARIALREARGDYVRAVDWLLNYNRDSGRKAGMGEKTINQPDSTEQNNSYTELQKSIKTCLDSLNQHASGEDLEKVLEILYIYMDNIMRNPTLSKFRTINATNRSFQTSVARFNDALDIMRGVGWKHHGAKWVVSDVNANAIWIAKSLLLDELMKCLT